MQTDPLLKVLGTSSDPVKFHPANCLLPDWHESMRPGEKGWWQSSCMQPFLPHHQQINVLCWHCLLSDTCRLLLPRIPTVYPKCSKRWRNMSRSNYPSIPKPITFFTCINQNSILDIQLPVFCCIAVTSGIKPGTMDPVVSRCPAIDGSKHSLLHFTHQHSACVIFPALPHLVFCMALPPIPSSSLL